MLKKIFKFYKFNIFQLRNNTSFSDVTMNFLFLASVFRMSTHHFFFNFKNNLLILKPLLNTYGS